MFDAFSDNNATIKYHPCSFCNGTGKEICNKCKGTGKVDKDTKCPKCGGVGKVTCSMCNGQKQLPEW